MTKHIFFLLGRNKTTFWDVCSFVIETSQKSQNVIHAVTGSSSGLLVNMVSLWFEAVEVTEAEVVAEDAAEAGEASGCGCWPVLVLVKLAAVCCK